MAITSGLLARAGVDLNQLHAARMNARAAFLCADRADHPGLRMWRRIEQARAAYWSGATRVGENRSIFLPGPPELTDVVNSLPG